MGDATPQDYIDHLRAIGQAETADAMARLHAEHTALREAVLDLIFDGEVEENPDEDGVYHTIRSAADGFNAVLKALGYDYTQGYDLDQEAAAKAMPSTSDEEYARKGDAFALAEVWLSPLDMAYLAAEQEQRAANPTLPPPTGEGGRPLPARRLRLHRHGKPTWEVTTWVLDRDPPVIDIDRTPQIDSGRVLGVMTGRQPLGPSEP